MYLVVAKATVRVLERCESPLRHLASPEKFMNDQRRVESGEQSERNVHMGCLEYVRRTIPISCLP